MENGQWTIARFAAADDFPLSIVHCQLSIQRRWTCYHARMKLLVTGAAGFIGSHFVLEHVRQLPADTIVVLDKLTYAADKHFLGPVSSAVIFIEGDIADAKLVEKLVKDHGIDTIVNFAAETHVDRSISDPAPFLHTNVLGVQN